MRLSARAWRWIGLGVGLAVVGMLAWGVIAGILARNRLDAVRADVATLVHSAGAEHDVEVRLSRDLSAARDAVGQLNGWGPRFLGALPVVGRSMQAERVTAGAALSVLEAVQVLIRDTRGLGTAGQVDLDQLRRLGSDLAAAARTTADPVRRLQALNLGLTPGFVRDDVGKVQDQLSGVPDQLRRAAAAASAMTDLLGGSGPRTLLIGLENNAELRGTGGLISALAVARADNGRLQVGRFRDVATKVSESPEYARTVPAPPDYVRSYAGFLANTTLWRNVNFTPSVPEAAQVMARLAPLSLHVQPDGIVLLDVPAMAAIVTAAGEQVTLPGVGPVSGDELTYDLLVQTYGDATNNVKVQNRRRAALERAAGAVVGKVLSRAPTPALLQALAEQVSGRHISVWSASAPAEAALSAAGAAGDVGSGGADLAMVTADNLGDSPGVGNKLDYYVQRRLSVRVVLGPGVAHVTQTLLLRNNAPADLGPYVAGRRHPGRLSELIGIAFAADARVTGFSIDGAPADGTALALGDAQQMLAPVFVERGASTTLVLSYDVPLSGPTYRMTMIPQPLVYPARLIVQVRGLPGVTVVDPPADIDTPWTSVRALEVAAARS